MHPQHATVPALAACAAAEQGKFKEVYDLIWEKAFATRDFSQENMEKIAKDAGLDIPKFKADMEGKCPEEIREDQQHMSAVGTTGTPAFYINGRFLSGARPIDQFKVIIDEELKKANERIAKGEASADTYYDKYVVKEGKKSL